MNNKKNKVYSCAKGTRKKTISSSWPPIIIEQIILDFMFKKNCIHTYIRIYIRIYILEHILEYIRKIFVMTSECHVVELKNQNPPIHVVCCKLNQKSWKNCQ